MKYLLTFVCIAVSLIACKVEKTTDGGLPVGSNADEPLLRPAELVVDIGTIEQRIFTEVTVGDASDGPNLEQVESRDDVGRLRVVRVNVPTPKPQELWVDILLKVEDDFTNTPVVMRGEVFVDDKPVEKYATLVTTRDNSFKHTLDVMPYADPASDSILVEVRPEALLMSEGTDPASIDPETATVEPGQQSTAMFANPLRFEFVDSPVVSEPALPEPSVEPGTPVAPDSAVSDAPPAQDTSPPDAESDAAQPDATAATPAQP